MCEDKEAGDAERTACRYPSGPIYGTGVKIDAYPQASYDFGVRSMRTVDGVRYHSGWICTSIKRWDW